MPEYTATITFLFILVSCTYKKHIKHWWWFRAGVIAFLCGLALQNVTILYDNPFGGSERGILAYAGTLAQLGSFGAFVFACTYNAEVDSAELRCPKCNYILKGLSEPRCPECGTPI